MCDDRERRIEEAKRTFAETVILKVSQLRRYVGRGRNPALTGAFTEELVRGFIQEWIGQWQLLTGALHDGPDVESPEAPFQIDGIIFSPRRGPATIKEGNFVVVHPAFCPGVIEIKTSLNRTMQDFEDRLKGIHARHFNDRSAPCVMGVVITDRDPEKRSQLRDLDGNEFPIYERQRGAWCPIFTLFKETGAGYEEFHPAIDQMVKHVFGLREPPGTGYW